MHSAATNGAAKRAAISSRIPRERVRALIWARVIGSSAAIGSEVTGIGASDVFLAGFAAGDGDGRDQQTDGEVE